jgi:DNA replication and repair protein RecF
MDEGTTGRGQTSPLVCRRVGLADFRNYSSATVEPAPGLNAIVGPNGQGKTNLLEAIHLCATGRTLRGRRDGQAVRFGAREAVVRGTFGPPDNEVEARIPTEGRKTVLWNGSRLPRAADLAGRAPCVCFTSASLAIVDGAPEERRAFLDTESSQLYPAYVQVLAEYKRALLQRNYALRSWRDQGLAPDGQLDAWDEALARRGAEVRSHRRRWVAELAADVAGAYRSVGGTEEVELAYETADDAVTAEELAALLARGRPSDRDRGSTQAGPHRDDLAIRAEGASARDFASQGQRRSLVLALKLAVHRRIAASTGRLPILLLDDVFSDLDARRRAALMGQARESGGQVFVTGTEAEMLGDEAVYSAALLRVMSGTVARP